MERNPHEGLIQMWAQDTTQDVEAPAANGDGWERLKVTPSWVPSVRYRLAGRPETESPPRRCVIPEAVIPAPLTEVPESGGVWVVVIVGYEMLALGSVKVSGPEAVIAVKRGLAYAAKEDADAAAAAMLARAHR